MVTSTEGRPPWKPGERVTMAACHEPGLRLGVSCGRELPCDGADGESACGRAGM